MALAPARARAVRLATALLLVTPLAALLAASPADAAGTITVQAFERGSGAPVPGACYSVQDVARGGTIAGGCDEDDDGVVTLGSDDECSQCRIHQSLPNLAPGVPTAHLLEPPQDGGWQSYRFDNYLKPYLRVTYRDAHTGVPLRGACLGINETGLAGAVYAGCDGNAAGGAGDQDGAANGVVETRRLPKAGSYTVTTSTAGLPAGYLRPTPVDLTAPPAETGDVVTHTFEMVGSAAIAVRTVDSRRPGRPVRGACYKVTDKTLGAGLGTFCDGSRGGLAGDQDRKKNGVLMLHHLAGGHTFVLDQKRVPKAYRVTRANKTVTTTAAKVTKVVVKTKRG